VNPFYHRIYRVVRHIPKGRVATYGIIARLAGRPGAARTVGWALSALPEDNDVPWWRVINAAGRISLSSQDHSAVLQRALLLREGVRFAPGGAVNLATYGWPSESYDIAVASHKRALTEYLARLARSEGAAKPEALARELLLLVDGAIVTASIQHDARVADDAREAAVKVIAGSRG